jgi:hypothetical protein
MITNKTLSFLIKKLIWYLPIALLCMILFFNNSVVLSQGFVLGTVISIFKILIVGLFVCKTKIKEEKRRFINTFSVATKFLGLLIVLYIVFYLTLKNGLDFFLAFAAGTLLINVVIFINSVTEALSLTSNNFE